MTPKKALEVFNVRECKLKALRVKKGYSQSALAKISGVNKRNIQLYEQGERRIEGASLEKLCDLCKALDCKIDDLIDDEEIIKKYKEIK